MNESISRWNKTEPFGVQVARGQVRGHRIVHVFGYNSDIDSGTEETVWSAGGLYPHITTPVQMYVSSTSANDTAGGTGLRTLRIDGITTGNAEVSEIVTLNGQTGVATVNTYTSIQYMDALTAGSTEKNAGDIYVGTGTITAGVPNTPFAQIIAGQNQSLMGYYTIPSGYKGYLLAGSISSGTPSNGYVIGRLKVRNGTNLVKTAAIVTFADGRREYEFDYPIYIPEGAHIQATAETTKNDEKISCYLQILLIKNE
jgi:hypothetical protein